jgi:hypothetical protein
MLFFKKPYTDKSIKMQYKELAKLLHPDKGGSSEKFKQMIQEKEIILNIIKENTKPEKKEKKVILKKNTYIKIVKFDLEELINNFLYKL